MSDTETRLALLERDVGQVSILLDKLDRTIEAIEHLTNNLSNVLQLHEVRLIEAEKVGGELSKLLEERRKETTDQINMVHNRLNTHIKEDVERHQKFENDLNKTIRSLKECLSESNTEFQKELREELKKINRTRDYIIGGGIVLYVLLQLITQVPLAFNWIVGS